MAVDTRSKRESALGFLQPLLGMIMPVPNGGGAATEAERQTVLYSYSGIAAGAPVGAPTFRQTVFASRVFDSRVIRGGIFSHG